MLIFNSNKTSKYEIFLTSIFDKFTIARNFCEFFDIMCNFSWREVMTKLELLSLITFYCLGSLIIFHISDISSSVACKLQNSWRQKTICMNLIWIECISEMHHCHCVALWTRNDNDTKDELITSINCFRSSLRITVN